MSQFPHISKVKTFKTTFGIDHKLSYSSILQMNVKDLVVIKALKIEKKELPEMSGKIGFRETFSQFEQNLSINPVLHSLIKNLEPFSWLNPQQKYEKLRTLTH